MTLANKSEYREMAEDQAKVYLMLREKAEKLQEALRFYADRDNWQYAETDHQWSYLTGPIASDQGDRAREALDAVG